MIEYDENGYAVLIGTFNAPCEMVLKNGDSITCFCHGRDMEELDGKSGFFLVVPIEIYMAPRPFPQIKSWVFKSLEEIV